MTKTKLEVPDMHYNGVWSYLLHIQTSEGPVQGRFDFRSGEYFEYTAARRMRDVRIGSVIPSEKIVSWEYVKKPPKKRPIFSRW